jgi:hypothetical protein
MVIKQPLDVFNYSASIKKGRVRDSFTAFIRFSYWNTELDAQVVSYIRYHCQSIEEATDYIRYMSNKLQIVR